MPERDVRHSLQARIKHSHQRIKAVDSIGSKTTTTTVIVTPFDQIRACPPWLVRLMAVRKGSIPYHHTSYGWCPEKLDVLVKQSGIPRRTFQRISYFENFGDVRLDLVEKFFKGCNFDPFDPDTIHRFMAEHGKHLFKLAPKAISRAKLAKLDEAFRKQFDAEKK